MKHVKGLLRPAYRSLRAISGKARLRKCAHQRPLRIVVGAWDVFDSGWNPTDIEYLDLLKPSDWERYFRRDSIDAILAEHVWEHITECDAILAAKTCYTYLAPGGYLRVAVPDGLFPNPEYIEWVKPGGIGDGADDHKVMYTYETVSSVFEAAGFEVKLLEYFDKSGQFHFTEWRPEDGMIRRSSRYDRRNQGGTLLYTSLILDARKPGGLQNR